MGGAGEHNAGASDRGSEQRDTSRAADAWQRVEAEKPDRDAARKAWDASHDPSPEFTQAARPLGNEYGRDRPAQRELTPEQRAELEEAFDRPADELLALREQDPRAGHNRDEQGRILDQHGQPRTELSPAEAEQEAERQAREYGPGTDWYAEHIEQHDQTDQPEGAEQPEQSELSESSEQNQLSDQPEDIGRGSDISDSEPTTSDDELPSGPELSPDLQAPSDHQNETDTSDNAEGSDSEAVDAQASEDAEPAQDVERPETAEGGDLTDPGNRDTSTDAPDATIQDAGDGMDPPSGDVPRPAAAGADEPGPERSWSDPARLPRPDELGVIPPDGKYAIVQLDDNGQPDWNTVEYHDGSSRIDQLQSDRRIRHDHGDQAAEPPKPTGDELSSDVERMDLQENKSNAQQIWTGLTRRADDVYDAAEKGNELASGMIQRPPEGQAETRAPAPGEAVVIERQPDNTAGVQDPVGSLAVLGLMLGAVYARTRQNDNQKGQGR